MTIGAGTRRAWVLWVALAACAPVARGGSPEDPQARVPRPVPDANAPRFVALETVEPYTPYLERRRKHRTRQRGAGPIGNASLPATPPGARLVSYPSEGRDLSAWLLGDTGSSTPRPGVVYLHNEFALTEFSFANALPLARAGFVVLLPTLRAENGNPGDFELLLGEVDDAKAAVAWLASHDAVDDRFVYALGHSIGGGIAALLTLDPGVPVRRTASVGGIYRARTFSSWASQRWNRRLVRFDPLDKEEVTLRLLGPNLRSMTLPHVAYAGRDDGYGLRYAVEVGKRAARHGAPLRVVRVDGGHMSSIGPAVEHFIGQVNADVRAVTGAARRPLP